MTPALLSVIMDFIVLLALAGTIYYAMRLSKALNNFKSQREEMKRLILELSGHIDKAHSSIQALKKAGDTAANDLDDVLHDSRRMAEELKIMNDSGNALANRLEKLAAQGRSAGSAGNKFSYRGEPGGSEDEGSQKQAGQKQPAAKDSAPSFFIKDADFDRGQGEEAGELENAQAGEFKSRAEKELYEALQKSKKQQ